MVVSSPSSSSSPSVFVLGDGGGESALVVVSSSSSSSVFVLGGGGGETALVVVSSSSSSVFVLGDGGGESALVVVSSSSSSVFVLGGRGSESALVSPSPSSSVFVSGDGGDLELGVFVAVVCFCFGRAGERVSFGVAVVVAVCFCFGGTGERVSFGGGVVAVVVLVVLVCFCFGGRRGRVSFGGGVVAVVVCFCFGRAGERVSFGVAVAVVCFCFGGRWRFGVGCETVRRRRRRLFLFWGTVARSWVCSSPSSVFVSGDGGDLELGVFVVAVCFCFGRAGEQLWCRRRRLFLFRGDGGESASGVRSNGLCPQRVLAAGGLVPVGFKHSWLSTSHYLLAKLCDGDSLRVRARGRSCARAPARRRERG